ncbi:MAG TPA: WYL domain-containing protein [Gemmatimonadales bacterium]|nr:WYL domain-containing protein [Gemmatimonadales bacterium]
MLRTETSTERLVRAVLEHRVAQFTYHGLHRTVEPHLIGLHGAGEPLLVAYQTAGESRSGEVPGWRTFVTTEIESVDAEGETFGPRPGFTPEAHGMVEIFARA